MAHQSYLPTTLLDLLSNSLVLRNTTPHLPLASTFALSATCKAFRNLLIDTQTPDAFRYVDLSQVKSADIKVDKTSHIYSGYCNWKTLKRDETLTEDEFYGGPLSRVFSKMSGSILLKNVQTLILDGLWVPDDIVRDIICKDRFNVRVLSIRSAKHLDQQKLRQVLNDAVRPVRAKGTPRLRLLYLFGPKDSALRSQAKLAGYQVSRGIRGPQGGAEWKKKSTTALGSSLPEKWYAPTGRMFDKNMGKDWAGTLKACEGIIAFDAVLCRGPGHQPDYISSYAGDCVLAPAVANIALGHSGCVACSSSPEGAAVFGQLPSHCFPLLSPPPRLSTTVHAAQRPHNSGEPAKFIARCEDCLTHRWCEQCNQWWDERCYPVSKLATKDAMGDLKVILDRYLDCLEVVPQ
ncbi:hypothetical protein EJ05DRAFT_473737 [Pseudovirgaria hyperparasitica]|uniref:Uncharacterized protein n=1 Tax=Pseudovirgaria hyperparasitica TaxID=470096 RepID=A0A6A6WF77_9PEZI|nr:uncharacterized protein EJ05DRAFT_473737 [Pseudovirgaria hyperparasitica]KAF2761195.1 hypothetical protein EJ05DRAFT_473737 [Pseudovirgaria hyperparasitica]